MSSQGGQTGAIVAPAKEKTTVVLVSATVLALAGAGVVAWQRSAGAPAAPAAAPRAAVRVPGVLELDPFVQNLAEPAGSRYLRLGLRIVLDDRAVAQRGETGVGAAKLRDRVLALLARQRGSALVAHDDRERLRAELRALLETLLAEPPFHDPARDAAPARVLDVLFTEFLLQ